MYEEEQYLIGYFFNSIFGETETTKHTILTKRDIKNRIKILKQQLSIITSYKTHFIELLGRSGTESLTDEILDELIFLEKELKKFNYE